jgi:hypothetical protein
MFRQLIVIIALLTIYAAAEAEIGTAVPVFNPGSMVQFAGRQAVYASGDTLLICFINYTGIYPDLAENNQPKSLILKRSFDGGQTFQTCFSHEDNFDGNPTLFKNGQTIIITCSAGGYIKRFVSLDNGLSFQQAANVQGSDRLPITDKYDGQYQSCYMYQDLSVEHGRLESSVPNAYGSFIDNDKTTNDTQTYYWGPDEIHGTVRANSDINIGQMGSWPTFYDPVITSGEIQSMGGTPPYEQVFRRGYWENVPQTPLTGTMIPMYAQCVGPAFPDPNRILMVTVNGSSYTSWLGIIIDAGADTFDVWTQYPPRNGTYLFRNRIARRDTIWTQGPTGVAGASNTFMVSSPLWIKGRFSGKQVWYSPFDIYIMDDITLTGTPVGEVPDGSVTGSSYNPNDMVALVSGKSIYVQYGYKDPWDSLRCKPNCGEYSVDPGVWIYASLYALGYGQSNPQEDGVFTFEYQHPHPSVPAVRLAGSNYVWDNIDLHRYKYPPSDTQPWPGNIDYPWYNPLWPEGNPILERGTVHLYGSIVQRRRGFLHRNLMDSEYPNPSGIWDIEADLCGGPAGNTVIDSVLGVTFSCSDAPGATGNGVGYKKDYHFDYRINSDTFDFNPWGFGIRLQSSNDINNWTDAQARDCNPKLAAKTYDRKFGVTVFSLNNRLFCYRNNLLTELTYHLHEKGNITQMNLLDASNVLIYIHDKNIGYQVPTEQTPDSLHVFIFNLDDHSKVQLVNGFTSTEMNDIAVLDNNLKLLALTASSVNVEFKALNQDNQLVHLYNWNPNQNLLNDNNYEFSRSRLHLVPCGGDSFYVFIWLPVTVPGNPALPFLTNGTLFLARGTLANTETPDSALPAVQLNDISLKISPNPFRGSARITMDSWKSCRASLNIYNLKGQLVHNLFSGTLNKGGLQLTWDGKDNRNNQLPAGLYIARLEGNGQSALRKVLLLR